MTNKDSSDEQGKRSVGTSSRSYYITYAGLLAAVLLNVGKIAIDRLRDKPIEDIATEAIYFVPASLLVPILVELLVHNRRHGAIGAHLSEIRENLSDARRENRRISLIEPYVRGDEDFELLRRLAHAQQQIDERKRDIGVAADLFIANERQIIEEFFDRLEPLTDGIISILDPEKEFELNQRVFDLVRPELVRAISQNDEGYWKSEGGRGFLKFQKAYLEKRPGSEIRRLFITRENYDYQTILSEQESHRIAIRTLPYERAILLAPLKVSDFVVYDECCVREAEFLGCGDQNVEKKTAVIDFRDDPVQDRKLQFDFYWENAD